MRVTRFSIAKCFAWRACVFLLMAFCLFFTTVDQVNGQWFRNLRNSFGANANSINNIPAAFNAPPNQQQFLTWVLQHTANVKQVDARILVTMTGTPKLRGSIQALPGQSPTLMWAHHDSFRQSTSTIRKAVPLEPEWLIEALGLVDFSTYESHSQPTPQPGGHRMQMISARRGVDGKQYRITVFDARRGIIEQQSLYNQQGELIAFTNSSDHVFYPQHNISLPRKIELHLFQNGQEVTMLVTTDNYKINSLFGDPRLMWQMPDPGDVERINLAPDVAHRPPSTLPAGGYAPAPQSYRNDFRSVTYPGR